jgi:glutamate--cysteine ligase
LRTRDRQNAERLDERIYLSPLHHIAAGAPTQAERWLERNRTDWGGDVSRIFDEAAF